MRFTWLLSLALHSAAVNSPRVARQSFLLPVGELRNQALVLSLGTVAHPRSPEHPQTSDPGRPIRTPRCSGAKPNNRGDEGPPFLVRS